MTGGERRTRIRVADDIDVLVGDDDALGGFGLMAVFADAAIGADGADQAVGGGRDRFRLFDYKFQAATGSCAAFFEEAEGSGVTINGSAASEAVFVGKECWALPMKEALLDGVAFGMLADATAGRVVAEAYLV